MKLVIQIPCYNEARTLPSTLRELPREIAGIDKIEWIVIDDGSTDDTIAVAKRYGVDHIVSFPKNRGLARAFMAGIEASLALGADIIVNTDGDNQYCAEDIPNLVRPILEGKAEIVIGERPIAEIHHFSPLKKLLQKLGSFVVRKVSRTDVQDAPSGFRALSREAALRLNIYSAYTYTLESIIQAGRKSMSILSVPIRVNRELRPSRLVKSILGYVWKSVITIVRIFVIYKPFAFFMSIGIALFLGGFALGLRFIYFLAMGQGSGHVQSLILASILLGIGFQTMLVAFLSDLLAVQRQLMEDIQYRLRKQDIEKKK